MSFVSIKSATCNVTAPDIKRRIAVERRIVVSLVDELLKQGFTLTVDDGGEEMAVENCAVRKTILEALGNTDQDQLGVVRNGSLIGWIMLVYGNDGWDVMCDWHTNLDQFMPKTLAL
jgi:hypothetical protein